MRKKFENWASKQGYNVLKDEFDSYFDLTTGEFWICWQMAFATGNNRVLNALNKQDIDPSFKNRIITQLKIDLGE